MGRQKKKSSKSPSIDKDQSYTDFLCPICLQILIEPVQMPCQHELCMACFKMHVENTSLQCPMCRLRISIWVRRNTKTNTLVNKQRWELIKSMFSERVARRLNGEEDLESSYNEYKAPKHVIADVGELRKEYEAEMKKLEEEREELAQANLEYIQKLEVEEAEQRKKQEECDAAEAEALQKEEMKNLGVTLKSPSSHQRALLALWKPKSPMKLRGDKLILMKGEKDRSSSSCKSCSKVTSPNHTITTFFKPESKHSLESKDGLSATNSTYKSRLRLSPKHDACCSMTSTLDVLPDAQSIVTDKTDDFQFAKKLQEQFNKEMDGHCNADKVKKPLKRKNSLSLPVFIPKLRSTKCTAASSKKRTRENFDPGT